MPDQTKIHGAESAGTKPSNAPRKREGKPGYKRVVVNVSEANFAKLEKAAAIEWVDLNALLSREIEKNIDTLIPQMKLPCYNLARRPPMSPTVTGTPNQTGSTQ